MANLVIMESPSKAQTVKGYLGSGYKVLACKGHIRDLPKSSFGIDVDNHFDAHYINIRGKGDLIGELRKEAKAAGKVFIATDPDREGEAIAWHLAAVLGIDPEKAQRVTFNEVTKNVVKASIKAPRSIDMNLVNAQQTRRLLDRIVGYKLSPLLWKNVKNGLSAGRVQSVATRMIVEREQEIANFVPEEYWTIEAALLTQNGETVSVRFFGKETGRVDLHNKQEAEAVVAAVSGAAFSVSSVKKAVKHKTPAPPFTTSTLQQEAFKKLNFQSQRTMRTAQELYEGVNIGAENGGVQGLITYMRTDSQRISAEAQAAAGAYIAAKYGDAYVPATPRTFKSRDGAQDAHEAIRPANVQLEPSKLHRYLTADQYHLYKLIWERFMASQMESAELATMTVDLTAGGYLFRTGGYTVTFPGYMTLYEETGDDTVSEKDTDENVRDIRLPELQEKQTLSVKNVSSDCHFTEAPPRFNDASLTKLLEEKGIGRPSTYNTIIQTICRNYVRREGKSFVPTSLGDVTNRLMMEHFPAIMDYTFTADMETSLDGVEKGDNDMETILQKFWDDFSAMLNVASGTLDKATTEIPVEETDMVCEKCGSRMVVKSGKFGKFAACPNYPKCKNTKPLTQPAEQVAAPVSAEASDMTCEVCGSPMVLRQGRYGSFYACVKYPACKYTKQVHKELGVDCPLCGSPIITKYGRNKTVFYSCSQYPTCRFSSWDMPMQMKCPDCGGILFRKKGKPLAVCHNPECGYSCELDDSQIGDDN